MTSPAGLSRRAFLSAFLVAGGATVVGTSGFGLTAAAAADLPRWSDPRTWGAAGVPLASTSVRIDRPVLLDVDATVARLQIAPGGALHFDPATSRTLTSSGNVVVEGLLQMRPQSARVQHLLRFTGVREGAFVGGGMSVLESDVGLWCTGAGILDFAGTPRMAWGRTVGGVAKGALTLTLQSDPVGWQVGDELAITPSGSPAVAGHSTSYDYATVAAISGRTITLSRATTFAHPAVQVGPGMVLSPEVLNLTRNVRVEGTPGGRTHVTIFAARQQHMAYFSLRHVGPRQADGSYTKNVLGRYGLHMHMLGDSSRGSTISGGVVRDAGSHSFVAHASHGITMTACVAHDVFDDPFWWDGMVDTRTAAADTNDLHMLGCVASLVRTDPPFRGYSLTGFNLGAGRGGLAKDCVAVGVQGNKNASGFNWPEGPTTGVWDFQGCIAHNNAGHGIFTWQNTGAKHVIRDFVAYYNGASGIAHGAYLTSYVYQNSYLYGNRTSAVDLHSNSSSAGPQVLRGLHCDGAGMPLHAVRILRHTLAASQPTLVEGCVFLGQRGPAVAAVYDQTNGPTTPEVFDLVDCQSSTPLLWVRDDTYANSVFRVQNGGSAWRVTPKGTAGSLRSDWNALVTAIPAFAPSARSGATLFGIAGSATTAPVRAAADAPPTLLAARISSHH